MRRPTPLLYTCPQPALWGNAAILKRRVKTLLPYNFLPSNNTVGLLWIPESGWTLHLKQHSNDFYNKPTAGYSDEIKWPSETQDSVSKSHGKGWIQVGPWAGTEPAAAWRAHLRTLCVLVMVTTKGSGSWSLLVHIRPRPPISDSGWGGRPGARICQ